MLGSPQVAVFIRQYISGTTRPIFTKKICALHVICGRGWVLLWQRCDTLCASGFMDDVIFALGGPNGCMSIPLQRVT